MDRSPESVWNECLDIIRDNISRQSYKTWFEPLKAVSLEEEDDLAKLTIQLPSRFYYEWLEEHYFSLLRKTVTKVIGPRGRLFYDIVIEKDDVEQDGASMHLPARQPANEPPPSQAGYPAGEASTDAPENAPPDDTSSSDAPEGGSTPSPSSPAGGSPQHAQDPQQPTGSNTPSAQTADQEAPEDVPVQNPFAIPGIQKAEIDSQLNDSYTFERFIQGDCNRLARSAAWAIAQEPGGTSFNPFLVYGGVGLGKTHLIHAIGNYARANENAESVLYVSSERFTTEFVQSIQRNRISEFSMFYRQIDLLIVDDVQFFSGKEKTQEEFFHIFNALHQSGKQIVLSADRPPRDIEGIEERLLSRFQWGLSADIQRPDLETRLAILQRKAAHQDLDVDPQVLELLAHRIDSNIRQLEGALKQLVAHAQLVQGTVDSSTAETILKREYDVGAEHRQVKAEEIIEGVATYFSLSTDELVSRTRRQKISNARQKAMYLTREMTNLSYASIGLRFGGRDHSTVIHANQSVENQIDTDPKFAEMIEEVRHKIDLRSR